MKAEKYHRSIKLVFVVDLWICKDPWTDPNLKVLCRYMDLIIRRGPDWIHGTDNNPMLQLAEDTNSRLSSVSEDAYVYDSDGGLMNNQEVLDGFAVVWDILADAFKFSNENCTNLTSSLSLKSFFVEKLSASPLDQRARSVVLELAEMWGGFIGDAFEKQSLKWLWLEECIDGGK